MTATEDRMRQAFDKAMFHNSPTIMRVQIAADVADQMVSEAIAAAVTELESVSETHRTYVETSKKIATVREQTLAALRKQHAEMLAALREVREWIRNWDPDFTQDEEWRATRAKMDAALAAAAEASGTGDRS